METVNRIVIKRKDGVYVNLKFEPVKSIKAAARFHDVEEYNAFMCGYYAPADPALYEPQVIEIQYKEVRPCAK